MEYRGGMSLVGSLLAFMILLIFAFAYFNDVASVGVEGIVTDKSAERFPHPYVTVHDEGFTVVVNSTDVWDSYELGDRVSIWFMKDEIVSMEGHNAYGDGEKYDGAEWLVAGFFVFGLFILFIIRFNIKELNEERENAVKEARKLERAPEVPRIENIDRPPSHSAHWSYNQKNLEKYAESANLIVEFDGSTATFARLRGSSIIFAFTIKKGPNEKKIIVHKKEAALIAAQAGQLFQIGSIENEVMEDGKGNDGKPSASVNG